MLKVHAEDLGTSAVGLPKLVEEFHSVGKTVTGKWLCSLGARQSTLWENSSASTLELKSIVLAFNPTEK